jgi:hypothetical protein
MVGCLLETFTLCSLYSLSGACPAASLRIQMHFFDLRGPNFFHLIFLTML